MTADKDGVEREAFIRLLDACDRFNGVISVQDRLAGPYQGQMILAVQNAYRVLGIGRTQKHEPLPDTRPTPAQEQGCKCQAGKPVGANDPQDCDWPFCGCDPAANKVLAAVEESGRQEQALRDVFEVLQNAPELNPYNYDHEQVCELNDRMVEAYQLVQSLLPSTPTEGAQ